MRFFSNTDCIKSLLRLMEAFKMPGNSFGYSQTLQKRFSEAHMECISAFNFALNSFMTFHTFRIQRQFFIAFSHS